MTDWTDQDFRPRGSTALYDAVWSAIMQLKERTQDEKNVANLICVISDGYENASKEISQAVLSKEIKALEKTGQWTFAFMLANQDIHRVGADLGVSIGNMASFTSTNAGMAQASMINASSMRTYLSTRGATTGSYGVSTFYNDPNTI